MSRERTWKDRLDLDDVPRAKTGLAWLGIALGLLFLIGMIGASGGL